MSDVIDSFRGKYDPFSNFNERTFTIEAWGKTWKVASGEHAFQALKADNQAEFEYVLAAPNPKASKARGRQVSMWPDWPTKRAYEAMTYVVDCKFDQIQEYQDLLISTWGKRLIEGNTWGDRLWGCVKNAAGIWTGQNQLGAILENKRECLYRQRNPLTIEGRLTRLEEQVQKLTELNELFIQQFDSHQKAVELLLKAKGIGPRE